MPFEGLFAVDFAAGFEVDFAVKLLILGLVVDSGFVLAFGANFAECLSVK